MLPDNQYPITEAQFRTWLEQNESAMVGMSRVNQGCPIYQAVLELTGICPVRADMGALFMPDITIPHPRWVMGFMIRLDSRYRRSSPPQGVFVTGRQALLSLGEVQ